jgi:hypothetical protein
MRQLQAQPQIQVSCLENALTQICNINNDELHVKSIFDDVHIPMHYYNKIEECNCIIGQMQLENISETLALIESKYKTNKINNYLRLNMQKCIQWCVKNNIEYNVNASMNDNNIFKPSRAVESSILPRETEVSRVAYSGPSVLLPPREHCFRVAIPTKIHTFKLSDYE